MLGDEEDDQHDKPSWREFAAGWGAGLVNVTLTFPLHKVMFRQMLHGITTRKAIEQVGKEGFRLLYRGMIPPLCQKTVSTSIMFGSYKTYGQYLTTHFPELNPQVARSVGAGLAGISEAIMSPFERIQSLLQDKHYNTKLTNSYHAVRYIWNNHGFLEFYRGTSMIVLRNSVSNIIFFAAKEKSVTFLPKSNNIWSKYIVDFISGGVLGAAISTMYYPLNVIKTRMQCRIGGSFESPRSVLNTVLIDRGGKITEMYRGVHVNYTRSLISWGIINASYELLRKLLYKIDKRDGTDS